MHKVSMKKVPFFVLFKERSDFHISNPHNTIKIENVFRIKTIFEPHSTKIGYI